MKRILLAVALTSLVATAGAGYLVDRWGNVATSGYGQCWVDSQGTVGEPDEALLGCGDAEIVEETVSKQETIPSGSNAINFDFDKTDLDVDALSVITYLNNTVPLEGSVIHLIGHTDAVGTEEYNFDLGLRRADAVLQELHHHHVLKDSKGETDLVVLTRGPERANRRVEVEATWTETVERVVRHDR